MFIRAILQMNALTDNIRSLPHGTEPFVDPVKDVNFKPEMAEQEIVSKDPAGKKYEGASRPSLGQW